MALSYPLVGKDPVIRCTSIRTVRTLVAPDPIDRPIGLPIDLRIQGGPGHQLRAVHGDHSADGPAGRRRAARVGENFTVGRCCAITRADPSDPSR
ncbi:hypothetical protein ACFC1T_20300 [Kitasatospora sp. NPDC056076]|uniref:hypothetical protein n=1 Tax=Kitasatospora sp. NPDC056076 TaxID=3345703 RepID=UPI0035DC2B5C